MIQQVKLVKYNIKSHAIIRIKHNNGKEENDIRTNTHKILVYLKKKENTHKIEL